MARYICDPGRQANSRAAPRKSLGTRSSISAAMGTELPSMPRTTSSLMTRLEILRSGNAARAASHSGTSRRARSSA